MDNCNCKSFRKAPTCKTADGMTIVIIPAQSGGSDGVFAPKVGDYKNTLVKYMADSKVFMYDKDGNYTFVGATDIEGVTVDSELSLSSTNAVQNKVVTKAIYDTNDRVDTAETGLGTEKSEREAADFNLQNNIDNEAITRENNDNTLQGNINAEKLARQNADNTLQGNIDAEALARGNAITGVETKINRNILQDLVMVADANSVTFTEQKINPLTGAVTTEQDIIPTASATTAGTISATEYQSIIESEELTQAILSGAVALSGIPASPTQAELTTAWLTATGRTELINRASIFDEDNGLIWTYYTNSALWYSATASITLDNFTNSTPGIILGSTTDGKVSANNDGTGSVSGWSTVKNDITALQTNKADTSSLATVATSGSYNDLLNKPTIPTVNNATLTIQKNGTNVQTFTANSSSNKTANITVPTTTSELTNNSNFVADASYVHTDNNFTNTLKTKLDGIASGAEVNVQSNWTQSDSTKDDYIKNKPSLATVATSGSYNDLSNKPTIPTINNGTLTIKRNGTNVATFTANQSSSSTANITVPTKTSDLTNDSGFVTTSVTDLKVNYKRIYSGSAISYKKITVVGGSDTNDGASLLLYTRKQRFMIDGMCASGYSGKCVEIGSDTLGTAVTTSTRHAQIKVYGVPESRTTEIYCKVSPYCFLDVQSSGTITVENSTETAYNNATDNASHVALLPPNNATLTIQKNGTNVQTFTADQSTNATANITVPTKTSELTNNSNFVADASYVHTDNNFTSTLKNKLDGIASGAEVNVQSNWTQTNTSADDYIKNKPSLATVATSGSYNDLSNKPSLATVATSGSYNDLSNKPTIPTVNNATLTIQKNGTNVQTFTANSSSNKTANITVPVFTMQTTDPGEGATLAADNFIAVY